MKIGPRPLGRNTALKSIVEQHTIDIIEKMQLGEYKSTQMVRNTTDDICNIFSNRISYLLLNREFIMTDMIGNEHSIQNLDQFLYNTIIDRLLSGKCTDINDVFKDEEYLILDDKVYYGIDYPVAYYIQKYCPVDDLVYLASGKTKVSKIPCMVESLKKYLKTIQRIDNSKELLGIDEKYDTDDKLYGIRMVSEVVSGCTVKEIEKALNDTTIDKINRLACNNKISAVEMAYKVYRGASIEDALHECIKEANENDFKTVYHTNILFSGLLDDYTDVSELMKRLIYEELKAKGELVGYE